MEDGNEIDSDILGGLGYLWMGHGFFPELESG